jgi:4-alpha-glucanotransferase
MDIIRHAGESESAVKTAPLLSRKIAGIGLPLFSIRTGEDLGIGEFLDLIPFIDWAADHHFHLIQFLPMMEIAPAETSPYQAWSAFAWDPIYLSVTRLVDFQESEAATRLFSSRESQEELKRLRGSERVQYGPVRSLKNRLLELCFERFYSEEWRHDTPRARSLKKFIASKPWIENYALFRLLKERNGWHDWAEWPLPYQGREQGVIDALRRDEGDALLRIKYVQWLAWEQWREVRRRARERGVLLMGDLPFLVSRDSADVWGDPESFSFNDSVGAPPDAFSAEGQGWGLPLFRWTKMEEDGFPWWRLRIREAAELFDMVRLDHVVGFFRVWVFPKDQPPHFEPPDEQEQIRRGQTLLSVIIEEAGRCIPVAEDLGVIPAFVYRALERFQIAGHKILRWQKEGDAYIDPKDYPFVSLATTGTHDTSTLSAWWREIPTKERRAFLKMLVGSDRISSERAFSGKMHRLILDRLLGAGSMLALFPFQDVFGLSDQVNFPATVGPHNWTWRFPVQVADLRHPFYEDRAAALRSMIDHQGRFTKPPGLPHP